MKLAATIHRRPLSDPTFSIPDTICLRPPGGASVLPFHYWVRHLEPLGWPPSKRKQSAFQIDGATNNSLQNLFDILMAELDTLHVGGRALRALHSEVPQGSSNTPLGRIRRIGQRYDLYYRGVGRCLFS